MTFFSVLRKGGYGKQCVRASFDASAALSTGWELRMTNWAMVQSDRFSGSPRHFGRKDPQPSLLPEGEGEGERIVATPISQVEKEWFNPHPNCPFKANASRSRTVPGQARSRLGMPPG